MLNKFLERFRVRHSLLILSVFLVALFFTPLTLHAAYRNTIQTDTPLYYWPMDEAAGASSLTAAVGGTAINLTSATAGAAGQVDGTSVSFNGTSSFGATASSLNLTAYNKIVVEALMYIPSYSNTGKTAWEFNTSVSASTDTFYYGVDGGVSGTDALSNVALNGDVDYSIATYTRPTAANWHHVVAVYDKALATNEVNFYIDGVLQTASARVLNGNNTNNFGNRVLYLMARAGSSQFTNGRMQHLAIYSDLSAGTIAAHSAAAFAIPLVAGTLSESSHSSSAATVSWTAGSGGTAPITTQLQRSPSGAGTWSDVPGATVSPVTDSGLTPSTTYDYRVVYTDATASTVNSNTLSVTLDAPPSPATAITLSGPTSGALGNASTNFTVGSNGSVTGSVVVTPSDSGAGGTFTPSTVTLTTTSTETFTYTPPSFGAKVISVTNNGGLTNPASVNFTVVGSGLILGDSTVAAYSGQNSVASYLYTETQTSNGWTAEDIAVPGHTIAQQKTVYLSTASRSTVDYTLVQVGLNDLNPAEASSVAIARLQDLVATVNTNNKAGSLTIISTMIPARQRLIDVYGAINGPLSYQKWLDINNAIKGLGGTPITDVDYRISNHTPLLDDGSGNLAVAYDIGDHIHENNAARQIIARVWRDSLAELSLLSPAASSAPIIGTATGGDSSAVVTFTAPQFNGGSTISGYVVTSSPAGGTDTNSGSTNLSHTISGLTNGVSYTFTVTATNTAGTSDASSASNAITPADVTAPTRSGGAPTGTQAFGTASVSLVLTTNESAACKYSTVADTAYGSMTVFSTTGATSHSKTMSGLSSGLSYTYYVKCQDTSENINASDYSITFDIAADVTVPTVSMTAPTTGSTVSGSSVVLSANASDNDAIAGVQFKLDTVTLIGAEDLSAPYATTWDSTGVSDGAYQLTAVARDNSNNQATSSVIEVTVDNTSPVLSAGQPSGIQNSSTTSVTLSLSTNEQALCKYGTVADTAYASIANSFSLTSTTHSVTISGLSNGRSYNYYIRCQDGAGNANSSDYQISFSIAGAGGGGVTGWSNTPSLPVGGFNAFVNSGSSAVTNRMISLHLNAGSDVKKMAISLTGDFSDASQEEYVPVKQIDLCSKFGVIKNPICPDGTYFVYVKFYTQFGVASKAIVTKVDLASVPSKGKLPPPSNLPSAIFTKPFSLGSTSNDVRRLQILLATKPEFYPEGKVTGYFGQLTKKAVQKFQLKYGIVKSKSDPSYGVVGPKTRAKLQEIFGSKS